MTQRITLKIVLISILACFLPLLLLGTFTSVFQPTGSTMPAPQQAQADSAKPTSACDFVIPILAWNFHLNACELLKTIINSAIVKPIV